jgi:phenylacetate-coenzyme A ligase PaaK-like adenylate-forming protein
MDRYDDVVTDPRVTRARVEATLAATGTTPRLLDDEFVCLASGGSSGVRGIYAWHRTAIVEYALGMIRGAVARLMASGGPPPGGLPMAIVAAGSAVHATRALPSLLSGDVIRVTSIPATQPFDAIVAGLNEVRPAVLQVYPSLLGRLADAKRSGALTISPVSVATTSETLAPDLRADAAEAFGVPIGDQFGSSEGLIGAGPPDVDGIVLADDLAVVELVDAADRPVPPGTPSESVLVTSLINRTQPMIRYRIEDRMIALPAPGGMPWTVVRVEGRSDDVLRFGDRSLHPLVVRSVLARRHEVAEYQMRQAPDGLDVDVVLAANPAAGVVGAQDLGEALADAVAGAGLPGLAVRVHHVAAVPRDPATGKARRFLPM